MIGPHGISGKFSCHPGPLSWTGWLIELIILVSLIESGRGKDED